VRRDAPAAVVSALVLIGSGCGSGAATKRTNAIGAAGNAPSSIIIALRDRGIDVPATITGGLVDVTLEAHPGRPPPHIAFLRRHEGVRVDQLRAASGVAAAAMVDYEGGNGQFARGHRATLTLVLDPGLYEIVDIPDGQVLAAAKANVMAGPAHQNEPAAKGRSRSGQEW
jgi:xanthine/CO dehydrogenase XdhC/CoxF family maturation factor